MAECASRARFNSNAEDANVTGLVLHFVFHDSSRIFQENLVLKNSKYYHRSYINKLVSLKTIKTLTALPDVMCVSSSAVVAKRELV